MVSILLIGCAPYQRLKPKPEFESAEKGYRIVQQGDKKFTVKSGKKYSFTLPPAPADNFYLVLKTSNKNALKTYFTNSLKGRKRGQEIPEQDFGPNLFVYPIDRSTLQYYWMIDKVSTKELELQIEYRYVPQWRFKFESKHQAFRDTLMNNKTDRVPYESIDQNFDFAAFPLDKTIRSLEQTSVILKKMYSEVLGIDSIFPKDILNSNDPAVKDYRALKAGLEDELAFQTKYLLSLQFFKLALREHAPNPTFARAVPQHSVFFRQKDKFNSKILNRCNSVLDQRFQDMGSFLDDIITRKGSEDPIDKETMELVYGLDTLSSLSGVKFSSKLNDAVDFCKGFNETHNLITEGDNVLKNLAQQIQKLQGMPDNNFYANISKEAQNIKNKIPQPLKQRFPNYGVVRSAQLMDTKLDDYRTRLQAASEKYSLAAGMVPTLNDMFAAKSYKAMLQLLKQNQSLAFLINNYKEVDRYSVNNQAVEITNAMDAKTWRDAEDRLRELHVDDLFLDPAAIMPLKAQMVVQLEDTMATRIENGSVARARALMVAGIDSLSKVDSIYADSSFVPIYVMTFASGNSASRSERNQKLAESLDKMKYIEFPETAIKNLYTKLTANIEDNGVARARAIVAHGKQYKGKDPKIKNRVSECDPYAAKWITEAKEYRRVLALPISQSKGENTYLLRLNVRIPTEAKFPVYDVNIKLPKWLAQKAASEQWYEQILVNKEVIKNEGRITITAPGPSNEYECQITPVRMNKDEDNIVEIRFKQKAFTVIPISVMAQKPLIKKN